MRAIARRVSFTWPHDIITTEYAMQLQRFNGIAAVVKGNAHLAEEVEGEVGA